MLLSDLNTTHPAYYADSIAEHEALYQGGRPWRALIHKWVPKNAQEPAELWTSRKERATYENHAGPIVDLIVAWLFSKPPTVEGIEGSDWLIDVDRRGSSLAVWLRNVVTDAVKHGRSYVWVNLPSREGIQVESLADEEAAGLLTPFLVDLTAEDVRDWGEDAYGNLAWVLVRREVAERTVVEGGRKRVFRWYWIDAKQIRSWEYTPQKGGPDFPTDATATERPVIEHKLGRLPVARLQFPAGLHVMQKLRDPVVGLTRLSNDLDWSLHRWANSLLVIASADMGTEPVLGAGYYLRVGAEDKVFTVAPDASGFAAMQARLQDNREDVYRVVQQMAAGVSGDSVKQSASGVAKSLDWQSLQVMLAAYAEIVKAAVRRVCQIAAVPLQVAPDAIVVGGLEGWQEDDLATILEDYLTAGPMVKSETFRRLLAKEAARRMIPDTADDATRQAIDAEIDAADYGEPEILAPPRALGAQPPQKVEEEIPA